MRIIAGLIPSLILSLGMIPVACVLFFWIRKEKQYTRKSPLTKDLLRPPGHSLRIKVADLEVDICLYMVLTGMIPLAVFSMHVSESYFAGTPESAMRIILSVIGGISLTVYAGWKMFPALNQRKLMSLGLEGEMATGEELNQLMLEGCRVYHDIPFPYGNIDHVVVSPSGIYSVNTKMLGKPKSGDGNVEIKVDQERGIVYFPDREYRIPFKQFETEANWLSQHLKSSIGQPFDVEAILALPGWFIKERIGKGPVYVINPVKPKKFFVQNRQILTSEQIQQVAHQLEQLCRDVEPSFGYKRDRWEDKK